MPRNCESCVTRCRASGRRSPSACAGRRVIAMRSVRGGTVLLHFWAAALPPCREQLRLLQKYKSVLADGGLRILGINVDDPGDVQAARTFAAKEALSFPNVFATRDVAGIYNIIYRYLFDR